jgi:hypothetical protein
MTLVGVGSQLVACRSDFVSEPPGGVDPLVRGRPPGRPLATRTSLALPG